MKARAAVQTGPRQIEMRELVVNQALAPGEVLLKVEASGMCGTDAEQYRHGPDAYGPTGALIPGHEPVGRIHAISPEAAARLHLKVGDRVAVQSEVPCGACPNCHHGISCRQGFFYGFRSVDFGDGLWGGYAEYLRIAPGTRLHRISPDLTPQDAVLYNPLAGGFGWVIESGGLRQGDSILILGCGQRGLASVVAAKEAGASQIIVTGLASDDHKLRLATEFGATTVLDAERTDVVAAVRDLTGGLGVDRAIDVSSMAIQPVVDGIHALRDGGTMVLGGIKEGRTVPFPVDYAIMHQIKVMGVVSASYWAVQQAIRAVESRRYPLYKMHTHTLPIEELDRAMQLIAGEMPEEQPIHITVTP